MRQRNKLNGKMVETKLIKSHIERGLKVDAMKKVTVAIPPHVLPLLSDKRPAYQVHNLQYIIDNDFAYAKHF